MEPSRSQGHNNAKVHTLLSTAQTRSTSTSTSTSTSSNPLLHQLNLEEDQHSMPAHPPPSYHMVVNPHDPVPNLRNPYHPEDDLEKEDDKSEELPEVTINATTQIRGHGNIISVPPMDAVRIAGLLHTMMFGPPGTIGATPTFSSPLHTQTSHSSSSSPYGSSTQTRTRMKFPKLNITVNCGATVFGDKNVVGPGLGEVARQMQLARAQQQQQAQAAQAAAAARAQQQSQPIPAMAMPVPILTPMMRMRTGSESESETSSVRSGASLGKRKAEDDVEFSPGPSAKRRDSNDF